MPPCRGRFRAAPCYLSADHLGSVRVVTDGNGAVVSRHDYLPFGEEIASGTAGRTSPFGASDGLRPRFTGQERDPESGLDFFGVQYYGSALGRFINLHEFTGELVNPLTEKDIETNTEPLCMTLTTRRRYSI